MLGVARAREFIPQFCFPDAEVLRKSADAPSEEFVFTLTEKSGRRVYGFVRRALPSAGGTMRYDRGARWPVAHCLLVKADAADDVDFALCSTLLRIAQVRTLVDPRSVASLIGGEGQRLDRRLDAKPLPPPSRREV